MGGQVILILNEGNDVNLCSIAAENYPDGKVPEVGDLVPLRASKTFRMNVDGEDKDEEIPYLNGLYEVTEVLSGSGYDLHPNARGAPYYTLDESVSGHRITLGERLPLDDSMQPIQARVDFGT